MTQTIEQLQERVKELERHLRIKDLTIGGMCNDAAAQAATIKTLKAAWNAVETDSDECLDFDECTAMLVQLDTYNAMSDAIEALSIPDNSAEVLQQWLDSVMGEPVAEVLTIYPGEDASFMNVTAINVDPYNTWSFPQPGTKLYRKPEIK